MSTSFQSQGHGGDESHHYYRQATAPTVSDPLQVGDIWSDTIANLLKRCTSVSPVTFVSIEGGSSAHNLFSSTHGDVDELDTPADNEVLTFDFAALKWKAEAADGHAHANDHAQSHDHSAAGDGTALVPASIRLPNGTTPTAEGDINWSDADNVIKVGDGGGGTRTILPSVEFNGDATVGVTGTVTVASSHSGSAHHTQSHAATHADGGADEVAVQDLASDAATDGQVAKADGAGAVAFEDDKVSINFIIDGGGSAITTGVKGFIEIPFAMTIEGWTILGDQSGSIVVDVWKDTYALFPPTVADTIAGTEKPTLATAQKNQDLSLTTWTTSVAAGDIIAFNVDSITTVQRVTVAIRGKKT